MVGFSFLANRAVWLSRLRVVLLVLIGGAAIYKFGTAVHTHYPIEKWLFWYFAKYWFLAIFWTLGCWSTGHLLLKRMLGRVLPLREQFVMSFAVGVFAFFLLLFLCGLLHIYGSIFFGALPTLMIAAGARPLLRYLNRLRRHLRAARSRSNAGLPWWTFPVAAFGVIAVFLIYLATILPENVGYDARWYHLPIAEHYAAARGVVRFHEGWYPGTNPHLASVLYAWAFQIPSSTIFDRMQLSAHIEFSVFLWTLASVPALVRRFVPRARASWAWVAMFLFPGLFLYDSSLNVNADHIAAFWAIPLYLALLRAWPDLSWRYCLLVAVPLSGALLTKLTAVSLAAFPIAALGVRAVWLCAKALIRRADPADRWNWWRGFVAAFGGTLVLTAPYWLKNWIWYGAPFYPVLAKYFHPRPWAAASEQIQICCSVADWHPPRTLAGLWETVRALYNYSFIPNDWDAFHGKVPVFGSLFTLSLFLLPFLRSTKRLWGMALGAHLGIFVWYSIHHQDRYLQALLPWMAAATAATFILAWRVHWVARVPVVLLIAAQLIWGGDVYFLPTHSMIHTAPLKLTVDMLSAGYRKEYESRIRIYNPWNEIGRSLDRYKHVVLIHDEMPHLGVRTRSVSDDPSYQGGIDYASLRSPREVFSLLDGMGVTHMLWNQSRNRASIASDLVFFAFASKYAVNKRVIAGVTVGELPVEPPTDTPFGDSVAVFICDGRFPHGFYHLKHLVMHPADKNPPGGIPVPFQTIPPGEGLRDQLLRADFLVYDTRCNSALPSGVEPAFDVVGQLAALTYYMKK